MIKNLYCYFCTTTQYSFILNNRSVGEEVYVREGIERDLNKWNQVENY